MCSAITGKVVIVVALLLLVGSAYLETQEQIDELKVLLDGSFEDISHFYGYSTETYVVKNEQGFFLKLYRIPPKKGCPKNTDPVFLMHALATSSDIFILTGPGKALAFLLHNDCLDTWLGNARGHDPPEPPHVNLTLEDPIFWDFSMHEVALYDIPALLDYVLECTKKKHIYYVGFSEGANEYLILDSMKPKYSKIVKLATLIGPGASAPFALSPAFIFNILSKTLSPTAIFHSTHVVTPKEVVHLMQIGNSGRYQMYDYGPNKNLKIYGQDYPPEYPLREAWTTYAIFVAKNDLLSRVPAVNGLIAHLPVKPKTYVIKNKYFTHFEYFGGVDVDRTIYPFVIENIKSGKPLDFEEFETVASNTTFITKSLLKALIDTFPRDG